MDGELFDISRTDGFVGEWGSNVVRNFPESDQFHRVVNIGRRELSQRQLHTIWELAETVITYGRSSEEIFGGLSSVSWSVPQPNLWTLIDGELHVSRYVPDVRRTIPRCPIWPVDICEELLFLAYNFIDLSPIEMGFEMSPASLE